MNTTRVPDHCEAVRTACCPSVVSGLGGSRSGLGGGPKLCHLSLEANLTFFCANVPPAISFGRFPEGRHELAADLRALGLPDIHNRQWSIQGTSALKGKG